MADPDLVETIKAFTPLTDIRHDSLQGRCPFCTKELPTLKVAPVRGLWFCLGCDQGGDVRDFITLIREFEKHVIDTEAHEFPMLWWYRIIPYRSYVKGWKISPSHYLNQDLATIWLDK